MHSSGSMTRILPASWMQSTGQTSTQDLSLMSMQGSEMMYVTAPTVSERSVRRRQFLYQLAGTFDEGRLRNNLIESGRVRSAQPGRVGVVRVAEDRHVGVRVGDLLGLDSADVGDHRIGQLRALGRDEVMVRKQGLELPAEEEVDPTEQDRRHPANL